MAYQVTRTWAIFGFCRIKSEQGTFLDVLGTVSSDGGEEVVGRVSEYHGGEVCEDEPSLQQGQSTETCALCHLIASVSSTLPTRHPGFLPCVLATGRETDELYTENGNRRICPVHCGFRRAERGGDDDGMNDNGGADDGSGHRDMMVAAERVVEPRPANYEIDPCPPVLKYEDYTAYDVVLGLFGSDTRSGVAWDNSYVHLNMEMGSLKDYKELVEEKIDFSDEEGARKEHFSLELQRGIEID